MPSEQSSKTLDLRVKLVDGEVERFYKVKKRMGVKANTEVVRIALKEAAERQLEKEAAKEGAS